MHIYYKRIYLIIYSIFIVCVFFNMQLVIQKQTNNKTEKKNQSFVLSWNFTDLFLVGTTGRFLKSLQFLILFITCVVFFFFF